MNTRKLKSYKDMAIAKELKRRGLNFDLSKTKRAGNAERKVRLYTTTDGIVSEVTLS